MYNFIFPLTRLAKIAFAIVIELSVVQLRKLENKWVINFQLIQKKELKQKVRS